MFRLKKFANVQNCLGSSGDYNHEVDDVKTSMAEIVKRFFNNEPIPQYEQNEMYDYEDETITHTVVHLDSDGKPLKDSKGNIISHETLNNEILEITPIHPNIEDLDPYGDNTELSRTYAKANEKLGAFQRVEKLKAEQKAKINVQKSLEIAKKNGYVPASVSPDDKKVE